MDFLKVGKATDLQGKNRILYRALEVVPGFLSWVTLLGLAVFSWIEPVWVAVFIIIFDVYWLLYVVYLGIYLLIAYNKLQKNRRTDWQKKCSELEAKSFIIDKQSGKETKKFAWQDMWQLVILPTYNEDYQVLRSTFEGLKEDNYPKDRMIVVLASEERGGQQAKINAEKIKEEYGDMFARFMVTTHPADIAGEIKGKGANQAWAAKQVRREVIDREDLDYDKILVSVFDIDTVVTPGYFHRLVYTFFTVKEPYRASYQPIPIYNNNIWQAPFFARIAAFSNSFWQMMLQIRQEKLATYSSHSMTWRTLVDIGFWSTRMVSEDSRIFFHSFFHYRGRYRVEPLYYPVSMDVVMDRSTLTTAKNLYKQQRRWGWGVENVPYLIFNTIKLWRELPKGRAVYQILVQIHGFHSWATNALIIAVIGWLPLLIGGPAFTSTVLSSNLPVVTRTLMNMAMIGMILSAIVSTLILPKKPDSMPWWSRLVMVVQWLFLPFSIILFGSLPGLEAQTRLMFGKYMGFWVTPKKR